MAIIKCKMCGGNIEFEPGATYGICEYCGSTSTIPRAEDEQKLNRYNRANHYRRRCEFDKAVAAYEKILEQDDTDAEAHWGVVLSRYGIEYVEDPATKKRIPTCHRVQVASILADADYLAAVKNAPDGESSRLYEEQAAQIAKIQKGILAISTSEEPYDVFICYKESDESGQRTRDSQWAQDVYYGLTDEGYKVFFSRITLEDKLGQQYEPYIFAALNSAKVMVVIGSKPEHFNAVWVKNEWSRYLALMANDRKRLLIPCYRDMDPYDLPEELSSLQSQDMSKIGFMQDLLRGVKKVLDARTASVPPVVRQIVQQQLPVSGASPGITSLLERAYLFMEDGDFGSANEYLDRVLDIDPKYAPAYAAKVCVAFGMRKESDLAKATFLYEDNADWRKALRFADGEQKATYEGYIAKVRERVNLQIRNYAYDSAIEMAVNPHAERSELDKKLSAYKDTCLHSNGKRANGSRRPNGELNAEAFRQAVSANDPGEVPEQHLRDAAEIFEIIEDEKAARCAKQCLILAEQARQKAIYVSAYDMNTRNPEKLDQLAEIFMSVSDYKDAKERAQRCMDEAEKIRRDKYELAVDAMNAADDSSAQWHLVIDKLAEPEIAKYRDVSQLLEQAQRRCDECEAAEKKACREREDMERRAAEAKATKRERMMMICVIGMVVTVAMMQFVIPKQNYEKAMELRAAGRYEGAVAAFAKAGNYSDAATQLGATYYAEGEAKREAGDWEGAVTAFINAGDYSSAKTQVFETNYQHMRSLIDARDYKGAASILIGIKGYKDIDSLIASDANLSEAVAAAATALDVKFTVGNYVEFGMYPQTDEGNDETPIEWLVLARDGGKALLLSRYGLDARPYNTRYTNTTWEKCTLRTWLNNNFFNRAFTAKERSAVLLTNVDNSNNHGYWKRITTGGNDTQDKVFLLSSTEANKYLNVTYTSSINTRSRAAPTSYATAQGAFAPNINQTEDGKASGQWWLRSPGNFQSDAACISSDGSLNCSYVNSVNLLVRPALWVNIESGIF